MTGLFWYTGLAVIGVVTAFFAIYTKRHNYKISTLFVFYLFATIITWIGESIALGTFNGYAYKPGLLTDPLADSYAGHVILNSTFWPGAAILLVTYSLGSIGISFITAVFILAEYLFVKLGIYEQHWWRYYMSVIVVVTYLLISRKWFDKIVNARQRIPRIITFYFVGLLLIHAPSVLLLLSGKQYHSFSLFDNMLGNMYRSSAMFAYIYHLVEAFLIVFFVCILNKWYWKLVPFVIVILGQITLSKLNILVLQDNWKLIYTILIYSMSLLVFILIESYTLRPDE